MVRKAVIKQNQSEGNKNRFFPPPELQSFSPDQGAGFSNRHPNSAGKKTNATYIWWTNQSSLQGPYREKQSPQQESLQPESGGRALRLNLLASQRQLSAAAGDVSPGASPRAGPGSAVSLSTAARTPAPVPVPAAHALSKGRASAMGSPGGSGFGVPYCACATPFPGSWKLYSGPWCLRSCRRLSGLQHWEGSFIGVKVCGKFWNPGCVHWGWPGCW